MALDNLVKGVKSLGNSFIYAGLVTFPSTAYGAVGGAGQLSAEKPLGALSITLAAAGIAFSNFSYRDDRYSFGDEARYPQKIAIASCLPAIAWAGYMLLK